ncbi:hypothetical protein ABLN87_20820 [Ruegeria sp. SCPT10]|uniref:hypothetical protein n=1 Tax=Ruegeria sp. SCP10 TaxID=3141377 RepID=UPI0033390397
MMQSHHVQIKPVTSQLHRSELYRGGSRRSCMTLMGSLRTLGLLAAVLCELSGTEVQAKDLGTHGPLFEVTEPSILDTIKVRLREMEASGELDIMKQEMQDTTRAYVNRPRPVTGLGKTEEYASWDVDLSITLKQDLADHNGQVFARRAQW